MFANLPFSRRIERRQRALTMFFEGGVWRKMETPRAIHLTTLSSFYHFHFSCWRKSFGFPLFIALASLLCQIPAERREHFCFFFLANKSVECHKIWCDITQINITLWSLLMCSKCESRARPALTTHMRRQYRGIGGSAWLRPCSMHVPAALLWSARPIASFASRSASITEKIYKWTWTRRTKRISFISRELAVVRWSCGLCHCDCKPIFSAALHLYVVFHFAPCNRTAAASAKWLPANRPTHSSRAHTQCQVQEFRFVDLSISLSGIRSGIRVPPAFPLLRFKLITYIVVVAGTSMSPSHHQYRNCIFTSMAVHSHCAANFHLFKIQIRFDVVRSWSSFVLGIWLTPFIVHSTSSRTFGKTSSAANTGLSRVYVTIILPRDETHQYMSIERTTRVFHSLTSAPQMNVNLFIAKPEKYNSLSWRWFATRLFSRCSSQMVANSSAGRRTHVGCSMDAKETSKN